MTVLEDEVILVHNKLSLSQPRKQLVRKKEHSKRKIADNTEVTQPKIGKMLNGYRSSTSDNFHECPVATLSNMGNTCFLNSVLYTLRFAPTFLHNLHHLMGDLAFVHSRLNQNKTKSSSLGRNVSGLSGPSSRSTSSKDLLSLGNCDFIPKSRVQIVTEKLHELFITMHNLELKDSGDAYHPSAFLQAVRDANYIFEGNHQQDAHELLVYLLDNIRETCDVLTQLVAYQPEVLNEPESSSNNKILWCNLRRSWKFSAKKKNAEESKMEVDDNHSSESFKRKICYNFVSEDFEGVTLRRTTCLECEGVTERKEPFYDIPVPIVADQDYCEINPNEIYRRACVTTEKLCDSNKYLCDNCKRYNEASREVLFEKLPNIMVLQLKRFTTTAAGVQKLNTYLPTPLILDCFCQTCCQLPASSHQYQLCCIIMHLGGTMASGHYIAYVKATEHFRDYTDCNRDFPRGTVSASSSEKSLNILKLLKPRGISSSIMEGKNGLTSRHGLCKSIDCCGIKLNKNVVENVVNTYSQNDIHTDMWLECDDENVRPITNQEFQELLSFKVNSTSTPYLLFYTKIPDSHAAIVNE